MVSFNMLFDEDDDRCEWMWRMILVWSECNQIVRDERHSFITITEAAFMWSAWLTEVTPYETFFNVINIWNIVALLTVTQDVLPSISSFM